MTPIEDTVILRASDDDARRISAHTSSTEENRLVLWDGPAQSMPAASLRLPQPVLCWRRLGRRLCRRLPYRQILPHLVESFLPDSLDRQQIIHALERAIRLPHLDDFFRGHGAYPRHLLQFLRTRRINI